MKTKIPPSYIELKTCANCQHCILDVERGWTDFFCNISAEPKPEQRPGPILEGDKFSETWNEYEERDE